MKNRDAHRLIMYVPLLFDCIWCLIASAQGAAVDAGMLGARDNACRCVLRLRVCCVLLCVNVRTRWKDNVLLYICKRVLLFVFKNAICFVFVFLVDYFLTLFL